MQGSLREKCPNTELFFGPYFPVFGLNKKIYSVNTDQKKLRIWTLFTQWVTRILNCATRSQPVECISYIGDMGNEVAFHFLMAGINAAKESKLLILFGTSSHIIGNKNVSDPVPYLSVITHFERNFLLFHVSYTEFWFNRKTSFMRIGRKSIKTSYNSVARDYKLLWCTELNCLFLVVLHKTMHCHCILSGDVFNVAGWFYYSEVDYETFILKERTWIVNKRRHYNYFPFLNILMKGYFSWRTYFRPSFPTYCVYVLLKTKFTIDMYS